MSDLLRKYGIEVDPRYKQCNKEAAYTFVTFIAAGIVSMTLVYFLGIKRPPEAYGTIWGLPDWAFYGVIVVGIIYCLAVWIIVKYVYKDMSLEPDDRGETSWK